MTDLTEQWKKGGLPDGTYWVMLDMFEDGYHERTTINISNGEPTGWYKENVIEVLAKVPTYEEYQALLSDQLAKNEGVEINAELEERLKQTQALELTVRRENAKLTNDCKTLAQTLLKVSPKYRDWLETNFKEYL